MNPLCASAQTYPFRKDLDAARVEYSYRQPTLFTITVDSSGGSPQNDLSQWHIPAFDPRGETKYMYKISSLDVYLWKVEDASLFLDSLRRVLHAQQLLVDGAPPAAPPEHRDSMSPVVQNLERVAITTPLRSESVSTTYTTQSFPGPPARHTPVSPPNSPPTGQQPATPAFAPMAYNPAAPAAPEPIAHREKTPPPLDAEGGTGLNGNPNQFAGPPQGGFAPQQTTSYTPGVIPGMPQPGIQRSHTITSSGLPPPPPQSPYRSTFAGPPQAPVQDPNAHLYANPLPSPGLQRQQTLPAGYNNYTPGTPSAPTTQYASYPSAPGPGVSIPLQSPHLYQAQQQAAQQYAYGSNDNTQIRHGIHNQFYQPEADDGHGHGKKQKPVTQGPGQEGATGKLEQRADRLEKGVTKFLKKLDKKF
jgi:hypothetical protein